MNSVRKEKRLKGREYIPDTCGCCGGSGFVWVDVTGDPVLGSSEEYEKLD